MKKKLFVLIISAFVFISCEEGFEPTTEFKEDYVMFGIINGDSTYQSVVISKSYQAENFDPYSNTVDPDIQGAIVTIQADGREYLLRDTSIERNDQSRYTTPQHFYYTNEYKPKVGETVEISAMLPNGKILNSTTRLPHFTLFFWAGDDETLPIDNIYKDVLFRWELNNASENLVYLPRFFIHYLQNINGQEIKKVKEIPVEFLNESGVLKERFPIASGNQYVLYDTTIVYDAIKELKGTGSASDITIIKGEVELTIMDENFGNYYSAAQTLNDGYTIKIYETNYSNISGGIGILGSYFIKRKDVEILPAFSRSFGYKSYY